MTSKLEQIHEMETLSPPDYNKLTRKDRSEALASLLFLAEKREVIIKGRTVYDGIKKQSYIKIEDDVSPMVSLDYIMITSEIEAYEVRYVATIDIPGSYSQT